MISRSFARLIRIVPIHSFQTRSAASSSSSSSSLFRSFSPRPMSTETASPSASSGPSLGSREIQLFSLATPNGVKISIALEELGVPYDAHLINIGSGTQFEEWFKKINPNSKIPAIVDQKGPDGKPFALFESGAILLYLADKYKKLISSSPSHRYEAIEWVFWQMSGLGPMSGQFNHFYQYAKEDIPYAKERYKNEVKRLLGVLDVQLSKGTYIVGDEYSIADIANWPWVNVILPKHEDKLGEFSNIKRWLELIRARPAVQKGLTVNKLG